jgi:hypothetical protein
VLLPHQNKCRHVCRELNNPSVLLLHEGTYRHVCKGLNNLAVLLPHEAKYQISSGVQRAEETVGAVATNKQNSVAFSPQANYTD